MVLQIMGLEWILDHTAKQNTVVGTSDGLASYSERAWDHTAKQSTVVGSSDGLANYGPGVDLGPHSKANHCGRDVGWPRKLF